MSMSWQQLFFKPLRWSNDILIQAVKREKQPHRSLINPTVVDLCPCLLQTLHQYRGQCIFTALCLSHFLHEICLPQSTHVPNVKFCLNFSPAVAEGLIVQPNCLNPSPRRDPSFPSIPSGVSWTPVCIWLINHLQLLPFTHQTTSRITLSPFEFSACPCCSLQRRVLAWYGIIDCYILWLLNVLGSWAAWSGSLMGANHTAGGSRAATGKRKSDMELCAAYTKH